MASENNRAREPSGIIIDPDSGNGIDDNGSSEQSGIIEGSSENVGGNNGTDTDQPESINGIPVRDPGTESGKYGFKPDGTPRGKPGRKPSGSNSGSSSRSNKSTTGKSGTKHSAGINGLEKILFSVHTIAAFKLATPELIIDNSEAKLMADAITAVQDHYGFDVSPEVAIWVNLVTALGTVYGPRIVVINSRKRKEKAEKKQPNKQEPAPTPQSTVSNGIITIPGMHSPT